LNEKDRKLDYQKEEYRQAKKEKHFQEEPNEPLRFLKKGAAVKQT